MTMHSFTYKFLAVFFFQFHASTASFGKLPFTPGHSNIAVPIPGYPSPPALGDPDSSYNPAFSPSTSYQYVAILGATAEKPVFPSGTSSPSDEASSFAANVTVNLDIVTFPLDQSPVAGTLYFQANISVPNCEIAHADQTSPSGHRVVTRKKESGDDCVSFDGHNDPKIYVTQNLTTGQFINVYYNESSSTSAQDPVGIQRLIVAALRTIHAYYQNSKTYEHESVDRFGRPKIVRYQYVGEINDENCWNSSSESIVSDQVEEQSKTVCWSRKGGVSRSTSGDSVQIGSIEPAKRIVERATIGGFLILVLSQNFTVDATYHLQNVGLELKSPVHVIGVGAAQGVANEAFFIDEAGRLTQIIYTEYTPSPAVQAYNQQPVPFSDFYGPPLVEAAGRYDSIWALDSVGALWGCYRSSEGVISSSRLPWANYTDTTAATGIKIIQFVPWSNNVVNSQSQILGFFISDSLSAYVLFQPEDNMNTFSEFPGSSVAEEGEVPVLQLSAVGPSSPNPIVAAVSSSGQFIYTHWQPNDNSFTDPAEGFADWITLELGGPISKIVPFYFPKQTQLLPEGADGVFVVMQNSTVLSMLADTTSPTGWAEPQFVMSSLSSPTMRPIEQVSDISFDSYNLDADPMKQRAIVWRFGDGNMSTLQYNGSGLWLEQSAFVPFQDAREMGDSPVATDGSPVLAAGNTATVTLVGSSTSSLRVTDIGKLEACGFDDPFWSQKYPITLTSKNITAMVMDLFTNINSTDALVEFRRNMAPGGPAAIQELGQLLQDGTIRLLDTSQSAAIFNVIIGRNTTELVESIIIDVINSTDLSLFPPSIQISAIDQSIAMTCNPGRLVEVLQRISNETQRPPQEPIADFAMSTIAVLSSKPPCLFSEPNTVLHAHQVVQRMHEKLASATTDQHLVKAAHVLANTRHEKVVDVILHHSLLDHNSTAVRIGAIRALGNAQTNRATFHLVHTILANDHPEARKAGFEALKYHSHQDPLLATSFFFQRLYRPVVMRNAHDLEGLKTYFASRARARDSDSQLAWTAAFRVSLIQHSVKNIRRLERGPRSAEPLVSWGREFGGSNAAVKVGLGVTSEFDADGVQLHAGAAASGSLFQTDFDLANAGIYAAWTSRGTVSLIMWMAVFLFDPFQMRQVPYYVINLQYQTQTPIGLQKGDPCTLTPPETPIKSIRQTRSFISATYYYGIPYIADLNVHVELVGWIEIGYGFTVVASDNIPPGQLNGYAKPSSGIGGQISASIDCLIASASLQGYLDFAQLELPVAGGVVVKELTPDFSVGFGGLLHLQGTFLSGSIDLVVEIWNCCCWGCDWDCCFSCGGSCNTRKIYNIFSWPGIAPPAIKVLDDINMCTSSFRASQLPPRPYDQQSYRNWLHSHDSLIVPAPSNDAEDEDSENFVLCDGYYVPPDWDYNYTPYYYQSAVGKWSQSSLAEQALGATFPLPNAPPPMIYDCDRYPDVCQNTYCYIRWYKNTDATSYTFDYDDAKSNRRRYSLSNLPAAASGQDRDEVPMNKCITGGCNARIQAMPAAQNRRHGSAFCKYLQSTFGKRGVRPLTAAFQIQINPATFDIQAKGSKEECKKTDFRYAVENYKTYRKPSAIHCPMQPFTPLYLSSGPPRIPRTKVTLRKAGKSHPVLQFNLGSSVKAVYETVPLEERTLVHSSLQNLTLGGNLLMQDSIIFFPKSLRVLPGEEGLSFELRLTSEILSLPAQHLGVRVEMLAEYSHLMTSPDARGSVSQAVSSAKVQFNVVDEVLAPMLPFVPANGRLESPGKIPKAAKLVEAAGSAFSIRERFMLAIIAMLLLLGCVKGPVRGLGFRRVFRGDRTETRPPNPKVD